MIKQLAKTLLPFSLWRSLSRASERANLGRRRFLHTADALGIKAASTLWLPSFGSRAANGGVESASTLRRLWMRNYQHPLYYRPGSSDADVITQVFVRQEYECVGNEKEVFFIVDCGANIGCTAFYFLHRYPQAHLIAIEPDEGNFAVCQQNLRPFENRVTLVKAGLWSSAAPLRVDRGGYRDGREWSFQIRPVRDDEKPDFLGVTIEQLLQARGHPPVDILKVDIETAEREVFREGCQSWLSNTRNIAIELHNAECASVFYRAMENFGAEISQCGELTVCRNIRPSASQSLGCRAPEIRAVV